jgi:iron complex transport system permease protein
VSRYHLLLPVLLVLACASVLAAVVAGDVAVDWGGLLAGGGSDRDRDVVLLLRLPRALGAFVVGALLALAGAHMQVLLRNPLADPYVLGVSGGAAVGALVSILAGWSGPWLPLAALAGALASMMLVFGLARGRGDWSSARLLLTGVVLAAGWGALISLLLVISPETQLRSMLFWLMGDLQHASPGWFSIGVLGAGTILSMAMARPLNAMAFGELQARALGVDTARLRLGMYVLSSLMTAAAVMLAGTVGFVGLVIPHMVRLMAGADHRGLVPACVLLGGTFLTVADTLARTALAPREVPVGVVTAFIGVPVFLVLLRRLGGSYRV